MVIKRDGCWKWKHENISGSGNSSRQNIRGKAGMAHSMNQMSGEYTY